MSKQVAVIGGGIAGLTTAYFVEQQARRGGADLRVTLLEASPRLGGKIVSDQQDGFVLEGGPDSMLTQKRAGIELCRELGLDAALIPSRDENRSIHIYTGGRLRAFPEGFRLVVPTRLTPFLANDLLSLRGKLRMGLDLLLPARADETDESVAAFFRRRFGDEAVTRLVGPLLAGIYVGDAEKMSMRAILPMYREMERKYGSLVKGTMAMVRAARGRPPAPIFTSLHGGMEQLVPALGKAIQGEVRMDWPVAAVERKPDGWHVQPGREGQLPVRADAVVIALPGNQGADLVQPVDEDLADRMRRIRYVSSAVVVLGYRRADLEHARRGLGFGFLVAKGEDRKIIGCTCLSAKFDGRADGDHALFRVFVGGDGQEERAEQSEAELVRMARAELAEVMGIHAEPVVTRTYRWTKANPQYDLGHVERVDAIMAAADQQPGLYLTGSAYRGISVSDCARDAKAAAERLLGHLTR
jgi:oxygen-dependent protoporphyrinogen oxidase